MKSPDRVHGDIAPLLKTALVGIDRDDAALGNAGGVVALDANPVSDEDVEEIVQLMANAPPGVIATVGLELILA